MQIRYFLILLALGLLVQARPAESAEEYFQQYVHYTIKVHLDTDNKILKGTERILYRNNSPDTLRIFYLHLYPNAFKSKNTTLIKAYSREYNLKLFDLPRKHRSYLDIDELLIGGRKVSPQIDETIAKMDLPVPLLPGDSLTLDITFTEKIREQLGRAGYRGNHFDVAQWYPKVVVYDEKGFHPDQFGMGEFYGEFGTFDVFLEVPENFVVAATGTVVDGDPGWSLNSPSRENGGKNSEPAKNQKTIHFHAEKVHDFAWSADPDFVVQDTTFAGTRIKSFYQKRHAEAWKDTTIIHGVRALKWLSEIAGPFPYPQISIVDALMRGGMEYPMLVMDGSADEGLVLHEVGHNYYYGALGNDERAEAWMDEGFTTFQTGWYLNEKYGPWGKKNDWNLYERITPQYKIAESARQSVFNLQRLKYGERVATCADDFNNSYAINVYQKAALILNALRYVVGIDKFDQIFHEYFSRWKFKHVDEERFRKVCEEVSGYDLGWFFDEWLHTTKTCDYALTEAKTKKTNENTYSVSTTIKRLGEIVMPLRLEFGFEDGTTETFQIKGRLRNIQKTFQLDKKPVSASLNPDNEIMDANLSNNFLPKHRKLQFDWPNNYYYPEDAYQIRYRPGFWYNDIDGFKAGLHFAGSYMNWSRIFDLGIYYGFESKRIDFSAAIKKHIRFFGNNGTVSLSGYKMEGRQDGTLKIWLRRRKHLMFSPNHDFLFAINYHELRDPRFVENKETYEPMSDVGFIFGYGVDPEMDIMRTRGDFRLKLGREWAGGKYHYEKFWGTLTFRTRREVIPIPARLRLFFGFAGGSLPYQQKYYLAGGGPLAEEQRFFLRSPGAVPKDLNYHEGGQGNLRGYLAGNFGVNKLVAMNFETDAPLPLPLLDRLTNILLGRISATAFIDAGWSFDNDNPISTSSRVEALVEGKVLDKTLMDAGLGLRTRKNFPFYNMRLRLDFPFYVNNPQINGEDDELSFRYVFSLGGAF